MKRLLFICIAIFFIGYFPQTVIADEAKDSIPQDKEQNAYFLVISKQEMNVSVYDYKSNLVVSYPMACGKNYGNKRKVGDMKTPEGVYKVQNVHDATLWTHDFHDGKGVIKGAYGPYFIRLYTPPHTGIGIHGTHDETSIGKRVTEGCIRLHNSDIKELVEKYIYIKMPVIITASDKDIQAMYLNE